MIKQYVILKTNLQTNKTSLATYEGTQLFTRAEAVKIITYQRDSGAYYAENYELGYIHTLTT